jgi:hypothetical protein
VNKTYFGPATPKPFPPFPPPPLILVIFSFSFCRVGIEILVELVIAILSLPPLVFFLRSTEAVEPFSLNPRNTTFIQHVR